MDFFFKLTVRETQLDIFGHVNNATYLTMFEQARWELMNQRGFPLSKVLSDKKGPIILEVHLKYLKELKANDVVQITFEIIENLARVSKGRQQMILSDGTIACELNFTAAFFDMEKRKIIAPNLDWQKVLGV